MSCAGGVVYRVRVAHHTDSPDTTGMEPDDLADYLADLDRGDVVQAFFTLERQCLCCQSWDEEERAAALLTDLRWDDVVELAAVAEVNGTGAFDRKGITLPIAKLHELRKDSGVHECALEMLREVIVLPEGGFTSVEQAEAWLADPVGVDTSQPAARLGPDTDAEGRAA